MNVTEEIKKLEKVRNADANKVFTMYLNTDPSDPEQQGAKWKINFKNGMRNFEQYLEEDDNKEELKNFQQIKQKVEKFITGNELYLQKGIVLFATADEAVWFADRVQMRLKTEFFWQETPALTQLKSLQDAFPKSGVILVQQDQVKVIDAELGKILHTTHYQLDMDTDKWRRFAGTHKGDTKVGKGGKNVQHNNFEDRYEANKHRWYKNIAPKLDKLAKNNSWEKIYVVGEAEASYDLESQMNKSVECVIKKNMLDHKESKVLEEVFT